MERLLEDLRAAVGAEGVLSDPEELLVYECDGLPQHKYLPRAVVFPRSTAEVAKVVRLLAEARVPFSPRGAGTGLSGGALALERNVVIELARMRRLLKVDTENRLAVVETGMVNSHLSRAVAPFGLHYAPDPSSQVTCTIGGNIAENAGGIHCLKYGVTTDHVVAARVVLSDGSIVDLGGAAGYDLLGVFVGSEGTFGIATEATVRLTPLPPAVRTLLADFTDVNAASRAVSAIIAAGLIPAALELMDGATIRAVEASVFAAGLPLDAQAALLIELDGLEAGLDEEAERTESICRASGARNVRRAADEHERKKLWAARKGAFGAMGRLAPDLMLQDAVVPRSRLPEILAATYRIADQYQLLLANVFHAGDGNLHPFISFDARDADSTRRVKEAGREIMEICVRAGGTITGEHGVGMDKSEFLPLIFSADDMDAMLSVRAAFDPQGLCNPGKIIPMPRGCGEKGGRGDAATRRRGDEEGRGDAVIGRRGEEELRGDIETMQRGDAAKNEDIENTGRDENKEVSFSPRRRVAASPRPALLSRAFEPDAALEAFARIAGAENVAAFSQPPVVASPRPRVPASLVVVPATAEEACEILRLAAREDWAVVPAGAGMWLDAGKPLRRADVILSTQRMTRIIEHEPADLVVIAEAGVTLAALNAELARAGQWLPLDPPDDGRATIGGVVATGLAGAQALGYRAPRGHVIGMRVALADGRLIKAGGRVVKNVAGYDLCKLFAGSYGTLGLILELTFKLRPRPAEAATLLATGNLAALWRGARALLDARLFPVALELVSHGAAAAIGAAINADEQLLLARFEGTKEAVAFQMERADCLLQNEAGSKTDTLPAEASVWRELAALPARNAEQAIWRVNLPPAALGDFLAAAYAEADNSSLLWQAGAGDGRARFMQAPLEDTRAQIAQLESWRARARAAGGTLIIERAPAEIKSAVNAWGDMGEAAALMRRIKEQLDPREMLSPARFFSAT